MPLLQNSTIHEGIHHLINNMSYNIETLKPSNDFQQHHFQLMIFQAQLEINEKKLVEIFLLNLLTQRRTDSLEILTILRF